MDFLAPTGYCFIMSSPFHNVRCNWCVLDIGAPVRSYSAQKRPFNPLLPSRTSSSALAVASVEGGTNFGDLGRTIRGQDVTDCTRSTKKQSSSNEAAGVDYVHALTCASRATTYPGCGTLSKGLKRAQHAVHIGLAKKRVGTRWLLCGVPNFRECCTADCRYQS